MLCIPVTIYDFELEIINNRLKPSLTPDSTLLLLLTVWIYWEIEKKI